MSDPVSMPRAEVEALIERALIASNTSEENARSVARALVAAEIDGQAGHGLSRVAAYAAQAASGKVDGHATPGITEEGSLLAVDVKQGFSFPAIDAAIERLAPLAQRTGIAAATFFHSHHSGQIGAHVERMAEQGCVAIMVTNSPKAMAPWGGNAPLFGTNPIAFAAPRADGPSLVIDLSLSKVARGKVMAASKRGESIPEGWAIDTDGNPTTDAKAALAGSMIPMGDAKGAALALMVEVLASTLTSANPSFEAASFFDAEGPSPGVGHLLIALRAGEGFAERIEHLIAAIDAQPGTRLPGTTRLKKRAAADGMVSVSRAMLDEITALAAQIPLPRI